MNTFDLAKQRQHFEPALSRPACRMCVHALGQSPASGYRCMRGGFFVTAYAICKDFKDSVVSKPS